MTDQRWVIERPRLPFEQAACALGAGRVIDLRNAHFPRLTLCEADGEWLAPPGDLGKIATCKGMHNLPVSSPVRRAALLGRPVWRLAYPVGLSLLTSSAIDSGSFLLVQPVRAAGAVACPCCTQQMVAHWQQAAIAFLLAEPTFRVTSRVHKGGEE